MLLRKKTKNGVLRKKVRKSAFLASSKENPGNIDSKKWVPVTSPLSAVSKLREPK